MFVFGSPRTCVCGKGLSWQHTFFRSQLERSIYGRLGHELDSTLEFRQDVPQHLGAWNEMDCVVPWIARTSATSVFVLQDPSLCERAIAFLSQNS